MTLAFAFQSASVLALAECMRRVSAHDFKRLSILLGPLLVAVVLGEAVALLSPIGGVGPGDAALGVLVLGPSLALVSFVGYRLKGAVAFGEGDVILGAASGVWLGWRPLAFYLLVASLSGIAWWSLAALSRRRRGRRPPTWFPFGPWMCLALMSVELLRLAGVDVGLMGPAPLARLLFGFSA